MRNATSFWGVAGGTGSDAVCHEIASVGTETCNGNGDGLITDAGFAGAYAYEQTRFWQHLANSGLIEGQYSGVNGPGGELHMQIGTTIPKVKLRNGGVSAVAKTCIPAGAPHWFERCYSHGLFVGKERADWATFDPLFTNDEAWNIDSKVDDGKPGTGKVITVKGGSVMTPNCASDTDTNAALYTLTYSSVACSLRFDWE